MNYLIIKKSREFPKIVFLFPYFPVSKFWLPHFSLFRIRSFIPGNACPSCNTHTTQHTTSPCQNARITFNKRARRVQRTWCTRRMMHARSKWDNFLSRVLHLLHACFFSLSLSIFISRSHTVAI